MALDALGLMFDICNDAWMMDWMAPRHLPAVDLNKAADAHLAAYAPDHVRAKLPGVADYAAYNVAPDANCARAAIIFEPA